MEGGKGRVGEGREGEGRERREGWSSALAREPSPLP